jgi:UDP-3-O-[3-hydroxymyristoyl] glucosamine N-acyltransferase
MQSVSLPLTAGELSRILRVPLFGNADVSIQRLSSLDDACSGSLSFCSHPRFRDKLTKLNSEVVVLAEKESINRNLSVTFLEVDEPKKIFAQIAKGLIPEPTWKGISNEASIHPSAKVGKNVTIGPKTIVCEDAVIGDGTLIYPSVYVGPKVVIGADCEIHPFVTLLENIELGNRVRVFSGTVIGSEGFGFLEGDAGYTEMPQLGSVVIEDDVRIGAKCTIDRSTLGDTRIGQGTKIDDQVHVGHNCTIGRNCILCAQVGLAGSTVLEDGVILAGQVGVAGHLTIGKKAICGGQTGVTRNLEAGKKYFLTPATPLNEALRGTLLIKRIPEILKRLSRLEGAPND